MLAANLEPLQLCLNVELGMPTIGSACSREAVITDKEQKFEIIMRGGRIPRKSVRSAARNLYLKICFISITATIDHCIVYCY